MNTKSLLHATLAILPLVVLATSVPGRGQDAEHYTVSGDSDVSEARLRTAIDTIFDDSDMGETRAVLVLHDGAIVAERYAPGFGPETKLLSWSIAKSVTAVLVGLMVSDGRLALDSPAPVPAWSQAGDPRGGITLRHLLTMSSGLDHSETEGQPDGITANADTSRLLFTDGAADMAGYAQAKPLAQKPGSVFQYSSATSIILSDILTRMLTDSPDPGRRRAAMAQFIEGRLIQPVGLSSLTPEYDARGTMIGGAFMHMTARDYGRFGEFLRQKGRANGRQILSERWVDFMTTPSARNPAYGGHIWLNRGEGSLLPGTGPRSLFGSVGREGQYILVSPSQRLTVVRLGLTSTEEDARLRAALGQLMQLFPG